MEYPRFYDIFSNDKELFQISLTALSNVDFNYKGQEVEEAYRKANSNTQKHVRFLDGVALLFVWAKVGDVCATTFVLDDKTATIHWAKNNPSKPTTAQQCYLDNLLRLFLSGASPGKILESCVPICREKILARCLKAGKLFPNSSQGPNLLGLDGTLPYNQELLRKLRQAGVCKENTPLSVVLDWFVTSLANVNSNSTRPHLYNLLIMAYILSPKADEALQSPIFSRNQLRQVKKIAAYLAVITSILNICQRVKLTSLEEKQVETPAQVFVEVFSQTLDAVNQLVPHLHNVPHVGHFDQIQRSYFTAKEGVGIPGAKVQVLTSQHCELTLALFMLKDPVFESQHSLKIGCSKASCHFCHIYIENLNEHLLQPEPATSKQVVLFSTHGKRPTGWIMPQVKGYDEVRNESYQSIGIEVEDILRTVTLTERKKSDSRSLDIKMYIREGSVDIEGIASKPEV